MKRFFAAILTVGMLAGILVGCATKPEASSASTPQTASSVSQPASASSSAPAASSAPETILSNDFAGGTQAYENFGISCEIPQAWEKTDLGNGKDYFYPPIDQGAAFLMIDHGSIDGSILDENVRLGFTEGMEKSLTNVTRIQCEIVKNKAGMPYAAIHLKGELQGLTMEFYNAIFDAGDGITTMGISQQEGCGKDFSGDFQRIVDTVQLTGTPADSQAEPAAGSAAQEAPKTSAAETTGQRNALSQAKDYLSVMAFSRSGLIRQLEFERFTTEEATYGADHCGADWNKQAAKQAQDYLKIMSFSRSGLIKQLEFEGFTTEEATSAADGSGADWNEQAAKQAQDYLDTMSFSRSGLIQQLKFEGFTQEQAEYGAAAVGY